MPAANYFFSSVILPSVEVVVVVVLPAAGAIAPVPAESALMALPVAGAVVSAVPAVEELVSVEVVLSAVFDSQEARPKARNRADTFSRCFILWCRFGL